jgi:serine/threonine protein kinase
MGRPKGVDPTHQSSAHLRVQNIHDQYEILDRKLGCGKYGSVYLAREVSTTRQVACKIVDLDLAMHQLSSQSFATAGERWEAGVQAARDERRKMMREIKILAGISHVSCSPQIRTPTHPAAEHYQPQESFLLSACFVRIAVTLD